MPFAPGLLISGVCAAGYTYWRFSFRQVTEAMRLEKVGRTEEARELLRGFLRNRNPLTRRADSKARVRLMLARLERKAGRYEDALREVDALRAMRAPVGLQVAALHLRADALAWYGDLDSALSAAQESLDLAKRGGSADEARGMLARILTWRGELTEARAQADLLLSGPGPAKLYGQLLRSDIERAAGDYVQAAEWARKLLETAGSATGAGQGGFHHGTSGQSGPRQGSGALWTALARYYGARAAWLSGDLDRTEEWLHGEDTAPALAPADTVGWWGIKAAVAAERGDSRTADLCLKDMRSAGERAPGSYGPRAWGCYYAGRVKLVRGRFKDAAEEFAQAIRGNPPRHVLPEMYYYLGQALQQAGQDGAVGAYECGSRFPHDFWFACECAGQNEGSSKALEERPVPQVTLHSDPRRVEGESQGEPR